MTTLKDLEDKIAEQDESLAEYRQTIEAQAKLLDEQTKLLQEISKKLGSPEGAEVVASGRRADFIEHGSPEHAAFMGLIVMSEREAQLAEEQGLDVYQSAITKTWYRLEDPITRFLSYPDPGQVAHLVLMQSVSSLESGKPTVPDYAPPLWRPPVNANY